MKQQVPTGPPVDCVWGSFGPWSECSATCGARGSQTRKRVALREAANGGKDCRGGNEERRSCNTKSCPPLQVKRNFYRGILSPKEGQATYTALLSTGFSCESQYKYIVKVKGTLRDLFVLSPINLDQTQFISPTTSTTTTTRRPRPTTRRPRPTTRRPRPTTTTTRRPVQVWSITQFHSLDFI